MNTKTFKVTLSFATFSLLFLSGANAQELKLSGSKQHVLPSKTRELVLELADQYLPENDVPLQDLELAHSAPLQDPFTLEDETAVKEVVTKQAVQKAAVVYDDASILKAIAQSLSQQIRGTLARGDTYYLQLQGGGLLKAGVSFPARIPQIPGEVFNVRLTEITATSYDLQLRDERITVQPDSLSAGSGVRYTE